MEKEYLLDKERKNPIIINQEDRRYAQNERTKGQFDIIGWLIRQNEYAKYAERSKISFEVRAGEIYEVDFGVNVNAEFSYRHYALVLVDSNKYNPLVLVCPLKSNNKGLNPASDISLGIIDDLDSDHESLAVINQIRTIDKLRIYRRPIINCDYDKKEKIYRLEKDKFKKVLYNTLDYLEYGELSDK